MCRTYASELAINEVTLRTYSDLQHYVEQSTEALVQSLRGGDTKARAYRQQQVKAAIRFCEVLFGHDYASLMSRAAENARDRRAQIHRRARDRAARPFSRQFCGFPSPFLVPQLSIAGLAAGGVKRRIGASCESAVPPGNRLMTLWFVFALMTVAAIFAVLWPLSRSIGAASTAAARPPSTRTNLPRSIAMSPRA